MRKPQWSDFRSELTARYGDDEAAMMICALTHDDPVDDCRDRTWTRIPVLLLGVVIVVSVVTMALVHLRRRRRA